MLFVALACWALAWIGGAQDPGPREKGAALGSMSKAAMPENWLARLRDEGTNRSQIAPTFSYLTDVIGPRLTASPNCRRANEWCRDTLASWGLTNAHLETWGPFGRGWSLQRFSAQILEPQCIPLVAWPKSWSHGLPEPLVADVVYLDTKNQEDFDKFKGQLKGRIVLISAPREVRPRFEPIATRLNETDLLRLANAAPSGRRGMRRGDFDGPGPNPTNRPPRRPSRRDAGGDAPGRPEAPAPSSTNQIRAAASTNSPPARPFRMDSLARLRFAVQEGAAATVSVSSSGDSTALMVGAASVISPGESRPAWGPGAGRSPWATNAPAGPPQIVMAAEQYGRLVRMIQAGETVRMALDVQTRFEDGDLNCCNTLAEIRGTDLKKELVMLGAHLDSAPAGTGASDNAAGVAVCMEAVRLLQVLGFQPRRTIRIGLWTGEEQGLHGSEAYVAKYFGFVTNAARARGPGKETAGVGPPRPDPGSEPRRLVTRKDHKRLSAYFNLDNGAGKIRGIHLQGNEGLGPLFRQWLAPFRDLGAETIAASDTGGTDHLAFDQVGLPGFQFIQDPIEYWRSYHTSIDVWERAPIEDLQQAAIVMAAFVYNTAMLDEKLPRKPFMASSSRRP